LLSIDVPSCVESVPAGKQESVDYGSGLSTLCSAHNLIKLRIADGLVRIPAGWSESCYIRFPEGERQPLEDSLNAGVSCWKHRRRSYLGEQFRQICDSLDR